VATFRMSFSYCWRSAASLIGPSVNKAIVAAAL
jgi:hypothetical protein